MDYGHVWWLLGRLHDEYMELAYAVKSGDRQKIQEKAADVANFATMIADNSTQEDE